MNHSATIVFMGTPEFAVPSLRTLHEAGFSILRVVTQPDRPSGRGRKPTPPPVKQTALELGYTVDQPLNVRDAGYVQQLKVTAPDFLVVVAFGQILSPAVLDVPRYGPINVHASLLPKYRGPAPIQWAILRGEKETGVTTMRMDHGVDTGDILLSARTLIDATDTSATLHDRLARMGAELLIETLNGLRQGELYPHAQKHDQATYAPMLKKGDGRIDWRKPAEKIDRLVRAMDPWPGAHCFLGEQRLKIYKTSVITAPHRAEPGMVLPGFADELRVAAGQDQIAILEIQGASGKRLDIKAFLHGHPLAPGALLH
jgi:methionyl-tRNA formyltransferase